MKVGGGEWEGGYEGVEALGKGYFWNFGEREHFKRRDCILYL